MSVLSVAMCTYNGAEFVQSQLDSISAQARPPDELVICDDASTDATMDIIEAFARGAKFDVKVVRNSVNLRSTANFAQAIALARGDVIALCDQDDYWHPEKLAVIEQEFAAAPEAGLIFSNLRIVDQSLNPLGYTAWDANLFSAKKQRSVLQGDAANVLLAFNVATGAAMAFRNCFKPLLLPIPPEWVHDAWIALLVAAVAPVKIIQRPLVDYRQHGSQQIGLRRTGILGLFRKAVAMRSMSFEQLRDLHRQAHARLTGYPGVNVAFLDRLSRKIDHLSQRQLIREGRLRGLTSLSGELVRGNYHRYSYGWKSVIQDLCF
jgi:glycosyltransferase involved in cell wall biosynthesis